MSSIQTIFSGFSKPFCHAAVALLANLAEQGRVPDLSHVLCVVPTAEAGRRLRAALALHFSEVGGVIPPGTVMPLGMLGTGNAASESEILSAWLRTLKSPIIRQTPSLLCNWNQKSESDEILLHIAEKLQQTRMTLAGAGLSLAGAAQILDSLCRAESAVLESYCRFAEFQHLEEAYCQLLGKPDPAQELLSRAAAFPGEEKRHIVVIGCPDAPEIFYPALEKAAATGVPVTIFVDGEADGSFDALGRPRCEKWLHRTIDCPIDRLRRFSHAQEESLWVAQVLNGGFRPSVIGVLGDELPGILRDGMLLQGSAVRFPDEIPLASSGFGSLFLALLSLMKPNASYNALSGVVRHGLFLDYAAHQGVPPEMLLCQLDCVKSDYLPVTAEQFLFQSGEGKSETLLLQQLMNDLKEAASAASPLRGLYGVFASIGETTSSHLPDVALAAAELEALGELVVEAEAASGGDAAFAELLLTHLLQKKTLRLEDDSESTIPMAGFLELAFAEEPNLLICGLNEENFKRDGDSDAFLPENARKALGMRSAEERYCADVARFEAIVRHREPGGSLTFSCAKTSASGDALMPARLFFQCAEEELPQRVELLFQGGLDRRLARPSPEESFFPFCIRSEVPKKSISVTSFSAYLRCPFRFYLEQVLGAEESNDRSCEFDAARYGTIAHEVLERTLRRSVDECEEKAIESIALEELARAKKRRFGSFPPGVSLLQFEAISRNLHYFAIEEARLRGDGWRTLEREYPLKQDWENVFSLFFPNAPKETWRAGITLKGQIDRIDVNPETKTIRVIDYKTYREPKNPESTHLKKISCLPEIPFSTAWDKWAWTDLQLPLYLALLRAGSPIPTAGMNLECAYFNLPLAATDTGLAVFKGLNSEARLASAVYCADQCLKRIYVEHLFWPPGKAAGQEDFWSELFGSIAPEKFLLPENWGVKS